MAHPRDEPTVSDVMTRDPVCVSPFTPVRELARVFHDNQISGAPVVDADGKVVGLASRVDVIQRCCTGEEEIRPGYLGEFFCEPEANDDIDEAFMESFACVRDFMMEEPPLVVPNMSVRALARFMCEKRLHRVVVIDEGRYPLGIITSLDLLEALLSQHDHGTSFDPGEKR